MLLVGKLYITYISKLICYCNKKPKYTLYIEKQKEITICILPKLLYQLYNLKVRQIKVIPNTKKTSQ